jgi:hypothetical protein
MDPGFSSDQRAPGTSTSEMVPLIPFLRVSYEGEDVMQSLALWNLQSKLFHRAGGKDDLGAYKICVHNL